MPKVFICHRRAETAGHAGRLHDGLRDRFDVFIDRAIEPGEDFVRNLGEKLLASDALLVVIGPGWLGAADAEGRRPLDDPEDWVRLEVRTALDSGARIVPVLVGGAQMPRVDQLPEPLKRLAFQQAHEMDDGRWDEDLERLVRTLRRPGSAWWGIFLAVGAVILAAALALWWFVYRVPDCGEIDRLVTEYGLDVAPAPNERLSYDEGDVSYWCSRSPAISELRRELDSRRRVLEEAAARDQTILTPGALSVFAEALLRSGALPDLGCAGGTTNHQAIRELADEHGLLRIAEPYAHLGFEPGDISFWCEEELHYDRLAAEFEAHRRAIEEARAIGRVIPGRSDLSALAQEFLETPDS